MRATLPAALIVLSLTGSVSAQGLIAFPWKECPKLVSSEFRCVWVADAAQVVPMRPREHTDRNFEMRFLNPGSIPATVTVHFLATDGTPIASNSFVVNSGVLTRQGSAGDLGYFVAQSDVPLLVWAWLWEQKLRRGDPAADRPPDAMSAHGIQVIPVDCNLESEPLKLWAFVCGVTEDPPPPNEPF